MQMIQSRRRFLAGLTATGAAGLIGAPPSARAEAPPETTTVRLAKFFPSGCEVVSWNRNWFTNRGGSDSRFAEVICHAASFVERSA